MRQDMSVAYMRSVHCLCTISVFWRLQSAYYTCTFSTNVGQFFLSLCLWYVSCIYAISPLSMHNFSVLTFTVSLLHVHIFDKCRSVFSEPMSEICLLHICNQSIVYAQFRCFNVYSQLTNSCTKIVQNTEIVHIQWTDCVYATDISM